MDYFKLPLWEQYSKKMRERLDKTRFGGFFSLADAHQRSMRLVTGRLGSAKDAVQICFYWLVDESDGIISDAKYQVIGPTGLIAAAEAASELVLRKNYDQASRLTADLLDRHFRDRKDVSSFPNECAVFLNKAVDAIEIAVQQCLDIPYSVQHDTTPIDEDFGEIPGGLPGWEQFPEEQKLKVIEGVIEKEIRPYIELDAGGIKVLGLREGGELRISYEGSCTTCHSSTGSTLTAIQKILRARVHPTLTVIPEL